MHFCNMLKRLRKKWGVNGLNMALIIATFAIGGSACDRVAGFLLKNTALDKNIIWWIFYILLVTILWPVCVIIISFPLGQFQFFKNYLFRIWGKMTGKSPKNNQNTSDLKEIIAKIAIFASGKGTNTDNIISYFKNNRIAKVSIVITDNPDAGVIEIANKNNIPVLVLLKEARLDYSACIKKLQEFNIDFIVLAGYLKKIPVSLISLFPEKIINIHPALLPKHGGKGMYGSSVHQSVIENKDTESGITIHLVDEIYDNGKIIFQQTCNIEPGETAESLAKKIHELEYSYFPRVIADLIQKQNQR
jgi:formyltetrahydrofolate-dependent phosphoribosylglycinamide formyltransferase